MISIAIRPYEPAPDEAQAHALWLRTIGDAWPLTRDAFRHKTCGSHAYRSGDHFVAQAGQDVVGFIATESRTLHGVPEDERPRAELMVVLVDPGHQRAGIGRALLDRALAHVKERGAKEVQLGAGGLSYFWAGVPTNLPTAWAFFEACGWRQVEPSFDLVCSLEGYATPPEVYERIRLPNIVIANADAEDGPKVLAFEARNFPRWLEYYKSVVEQGAHSDIVVAWDAQTNEVVGTSMVMDFRDPSRRHDFVWERLLGENTGGVGPLGVADDRRGNGIGLALAARVTELLKARGVATSFVGYTWLVDWYGRLGYQLWRQYNMSWKRL